MSEFCGECNRIVSNARRHMDRNRCKALKERRMERGATIERKTRGMLRAEKKEKTKENQKLGRLKKK